MLYINTAQGLTLQSALEQCVAMLTRGDNRAIAVLYTPDRCWLARVEANALAYDAAGALIPLEDVYEARVFSQAAEMRWLNQDEGHGRAALLAEDEIVGAMQGPVEKVVTAGTIEQRYLLWGKGTGHQIANGWSQLATARIGTLLVPLDGVASNQRTQLVAREYLREYESGNLGVAEERLLDLRLEASHG